MSIMDIIPHQNQPTNQTNQNAHIYVQFENIYICIMPKYFDNFLDHKSILSLSLVNKAIYSRACFCKKHSNHKHECKQLTETLFRQCSRVKFTSTCFKICPCGKKLYICTGGGCPKHNCRCTLCLIHARVNRR